MTSLAALAAKVEAGVHQRADVDRLAHHVTTIKHAEATATELAPKVSAAARLAVAALEAGLDVQVNGLRGLAARIERLTRQVRSQNFDIAEPNRLFEDIRAEVSSVESQVTIGWHELVDRRIPGREGLGSLADAFRALGRVGQLAGDLKKAVLATERLRRSQPSAASLDELDLLATSIPQFVRDMVGEEPSVRDFADKIARGGADLAALTPAVREWLDANGLQLSFKIVPGSPEV